MYRYFDRNSNIIQSFVWFPNSVASISITLSEASRKLGTFSILRHVPSSASANPKVVNLCSVFNFDFYIK